MSTGIAERVSIRPRIEVTDDLKKKVDDIAVKYVMGEFDNMGLYTLNLGRHARSVGMSFSQFVDELREAIERLQSKPIQLDHRSPVVSLLMKKQ